MQKLSLAQALDPQVAVDRACLGTFYCDHPLDKIIWDVTCKDHSFLPPDAGLDFTLFYSLLRPNDREPTQRAIEQAMNGQGEYDVEHHTSRC